jgi:hypothetical protein
VFGTFLQGFDLGMTFVARFPEVIDPIVPRSVLLRRGKCGNQQGNGKNGQNDIYDIPFPHTRTSVSHTIHYLFVGWFTLLQ